MFRALKFHPYDHLISTLIPMSFTHATIKMFLIYVKIKMCSLYFSTNVNLKRAIWQKRKRTQDRFVYIALTLRLAG